MFRKVVLLAFIALALFSAKFVKSVDPLPVVSQKEWKGLIEFYEKSLSPDWIQVSAERKVKSLKIEHTSLRKALYASRINTRKAADITAQLEAIETRIAEIQEYLDNPKRESAEKTRLRKEVIELLKPLDSLNPNGEAPLRLPRL